MKLRNQLLALFCLLVFIGFGFLYFRAWVVQKPFGIILFVGDGLAGSNLTVARLYAGGADERLAIERLPNVALVSNHANDFAVPDSPAAASALATGMKVNNRSISIDPHGKALASILDTAGASGRAVGLITTGNLTDATTAAFYAHAANGDDGANIAAQLADNAKLDMALGGGAANFMSESNGGKRKDGRDLLLELKQKGGEIFRSKAELENAPVFSSARRVGIFSNGDLPYSTQLESGSQQPSLSDMVRRAIEFLQYNRGGYFLVVNAALITRAAEQNDGEHVITETLDLDRAVATALKYAGENTLIVAVGKHSTGGMALNGYPLRQDHGVGLLGTNAFGFPSITWATGPNGVARDAAGPAAQATSVKPPGNVAPAAFYAPSAINTAGDVIAVGAGPGSEAVRGFLDNTEIFQILKNNL